jgi:hypothetical protein
MTDLLPFGTRVAVTHVTRPVYLTWKTHDEVFDPPSIAGALSLARKVRRDSPVLVRAGEPFPDHESDIGLDLPEPSEVPANGVHRRLRRWPADRPDAVVVGRTYRIEGQYNAASGGGSYWYGESEWEPAFLTESRRVWVYQVALRPDGWDRTAWPAAVELAVPEDVLPLITKAVAA